jgi:hypothetical protein
MLATMAERGTLAPMVHIYEHEGVMLRVDYEPGADGIPTFNDVRVLDADYRPVGPNLTNMLDSTLLMSPPDALGEHSAMTFLSAIVEELYVGESASGC